MDENARVLELFTKEIAGDVRQFKASSIALRDSWSTRMYWHDKRGSADDILTDTAPETITELLEKNRQATNIYANQKLTLSGWEGYTKRMDRAVERQREVLDELLAGFEEFGTVCESIRLFQQQRKGARGWFRRAFAAIRRFGFRP